MAKLTQHSTAQHTECECHTSEHICKFTAHRWTWCGKYKMVSSPRYKQALFAPLFLAIKLVAQRSYIFHRVAIWILFLFYFYFLFCFHPVSLHLSSFSSILSPFVPIHLLVAAGVLCVCCTYDKRQNTCSVFDAIFSVIRIHCAKVLGEYVNRYDFESRRFGAKANTHLLARSLARLLAHKHTERRQSICRRVFLCCRTSYSCLCCVNNSSGVVWLWNYASPTRSRQTPKQRVRPTATQSVCIHKRDK